MYNSLFVCGVFLPFFTLGISIYKYFIFHAKLGRVVRYKDFECIFRKNSKILNIEISGKWQKDEDCNK